MPVKYHSVKNIEDYDIICVKVLHKGILRNTYKITKAKIKGNLGNWCYEIDLKKYSATLKGTMKITLRLERNVVAEVLDVEDKTISDYLYFVKTGRKLSFQFNQNIDQKMIILRKHVKDTKDTKASKHDYPKSVPDQNQIKQIMPSIEQQLLPHQPEISKTDQASLNRIELDSNWHQSEDGFTTRDAFASGIQGGRGSAQINDFMRHNNSGHLGGMGQGGAR